MFASTATAAPPFRARDFWLQFSLRLGTPQLKSKNEMTVPWSIFSLLRQSVYTEHRHLFNFNRNLIKFIVLYDTAPTWVCTRIDWNQTINNWYERLNDSNVHRSVAHTQRVIFCWPFKPFHRGAAANRYFLLESIHTPRTHSFYDYCKFKRSNRHRIWFTFE